jgi:hypothetical protein
MQTMSYGVSQFFRAEVSWLGLTPAAMRRLLSILAILSATSPVVAQDIEFLHRSDGSPRLKPTEIIYEGFISYGNYRVFGAAENVKLQATGVELDRELWPSLLHTRVDAVCEVLPVVLLTQPKRADVWGNPLSTTKELVPGTGVSPVGFRLLWRDGKRLMPHFEAKGSVLGFTQKALSPDATYENWSFHLTQGVRVGIRDRYDLRLGLLSDLHFSNAFVVRSNPAADLMNVDVGLVYHPGNSRKSLESPSEHKFSQGR